MRFRVRLTIGALFFFVASLAARAQGTLRFADLNDFRRENGQTIRQCRIGCRTFGMLNGEGYNVVLFLTWFTGNSQNPIGHIGRGKLADSGWYFVVAMDVRETDAKVGYGGELGG